MTHKRSRFTGQQGKGEVETQYSMLKHNMEHNTMLKHHVETQHSNSMLKLHVEIPC